MKYIKPFENLRKEDVLAAGGKGASLGEMTNAGIPVPPGYVILSSAFDTFLSETGIQVDVEAILAKTHHDVMHEVERSSEEIQEIILSQEFPQALREEVLSSFKDLNAEFVAVRSSATAEDGAEHAWAGQLDTFLNTTEENVLENIKKCWASLFTPRAIFYRFEKGLAATHISVAVVVQRMVDSEYAGIAFSVHPVTEDRNQMIIEAGFGLGEAIVSGQVTPDSYVITKSSRQIIDVNVSEQPRALYRMSGGGNEWRELGEKGGKQVLTKEEILELSDIITRIENHYGFPCDIEWAYEGGKFYITQSRPITTLSGGDVSESEPPIVLEKSFTRERPLFYYYAFPDADKAGIQKYLGRDIDDILFIIQPKGMPGEVWYPQKAFEELSNLALERLNSDKDLRDSIARDLDAAWAQISPYFLQGKEIETKEEAFVYYQYVIDFWMALNTLFFCLVDNPHLHKEFSEKLKSVRDGTQEYTALMSEKFVTYFEKAFPEYAHVSHYITPTEVRDLERNDSQLMAILEERSRVGCFVYRDVLYLLPELDDVAQKNNLLLKQESTDSATEVKGQTAFKGKVRGLVKMVRRRADLEKVKEGDILVSPITDANYVPAMQRSSAFVTDEGGITCHAAIVARELKKPCIIGTEFATQVLKDGDLVEVNADEGVVRVLDRVINRNDFSLNFSAEGVQLLFSDINVLTYSPSTAVEFTVGTTYSSYYANACLNEMHLRAKGADFYELLQTKAVMINKAVEKISQENLSSVEKLSKEHVMRVVGLFHEVARGFGFYNNGYLDGFFNSTVALEYPDKVTQVGVLKNNLREKVNAVFFEQGSPYEIMLKNIERGYGVSYSDLMFYRIEELYELFDGKKVSSEEIAARTLYFLFIKTNDQLVFFSGDDARIRIEAFYPEVNVNDNELQGTIANPGQYVGRVRNIVTDYSNFAAMSVAIGEMKEGEVLVSQMTAPELMPALVKAGAIVTDLGGLLSHAAITSRELNKPCVIGTGVASKVLKTGDLVEVDADNGVVRILKNKKFPPDVYSKWSKNWDSQFSLLACDIGLKVYLSFEKTFGASLIPVVIHKRGYSSCFYVDEQLDTFTSRLWDLYQEDKSRLDAWIKEAKQGSDQLSEIIKNGDGLESLQAFMECVDAFGGPNFAIREITNRLDTIKNGEEMEKVIEYRKYTELYYYNTDVYLNKVALFVAEKSGYEKEMIQSLTVTELYSYLKGGELPPQGVLHSRYEHSVAWFIDGVFSFYEGDLNKAENVLRGTYDGSGSFKGVKAYGGKIKGRVKKITSYDASVSILPDEILVTGMTDPRFIQLMHIAAGYVTDAGGMLSHAAIVARELKRPCIVGTKVATKVLKDGDLVEVDADQGIVRIVSY